MFDWLIIIELKCDPLTASKKSGDGILDSELWLAIYFFQQKRFWSQVLAKAQELRIGEPKREGEQKQVC